MVQRIPWFAHLFGIKPWEIERLEYEDFEEMSGLIDRWIDNGASWVAPGHVGLDYR